MSQNTTPTRPTLAEFEARMKAATSPQEQADIVAEIHRHYGLAGNAPAAGGEARPTIAALEAEMIAANGDPAKVAAVCARVEKFYGQP